MGPDRGAEGPGESSGGLVSREGRSWEQARRVAEGESSVTGQGSGGRRQARQA